MGMETGGAKRFASLLAVLAIGFACGRLFSTRPAVSVVSLSPPTRTSVPPRPAAAPSPAPHPADPSASPSPPSRAQLDREDRLHEIDVALDDIPDDDAVRLSELASQLRAQRTSLSALRDRISASERALYTETLHRPPESELARQHLAVEEQSAALTQELSAARIAVAEQQHWLDLSAGSSPDAEPYVEMKNELVRRKALVNDLTRRIAQLHENEDQGLAALDLVEQTRLRNWRADRAELDAAYAQASAQLADTNRLYQELAAEAAEHRKQAAALEAERKKLIGQE
jgi:hypothetical protein